MTPFSDEYCPRVPSTSGCPACPIMMTLSSRLEQALTSAWTRVTSGQVASKTRRGRDFASFLTLSGTPCAEKMRTLPSGTSLRSSMKTAPRSLSPSTTKRLCTTSCLTYTGAPNFLSAASTMPTALVTPAQKPRGTAR